MLGIEFPPEDQLERTLQEGLKEVIINLRGRKICDLVHEKEIEDPNLILAMNLMSGIWTSNYNLGNQVLMSNISAKVKIYIFNNN